MSGAFAAPSSSTASLAGMLVATLACLPWVRPAAAYGADAGRATAEGLAVMLLVPWLADKLGQSNPPLVGWAVAVASMPLVLAVDALDKRLRAAQRRR